MKVITIPAKMGIILTTALFTVITNQTAFALAGSCGDGVPSHKWDCTFDKKVTGTVKGPITRKKGGKEVMCGAIDCNQGCVPTDSTLCVNRGKACEYPNDPNDCTIYSKGVVTTNHSLWKECDKITATMTPAQEQQAIRDCCNEWDDGLCEDDTKVMDFTCDSNGQEFECCGTCADEVQPVFIDINPDYIVVPLLSSPTTLQQRTNTSTGTSTLR